MGTWSLFEGIGELRHSTVGKIVSVTVSAALVFSLSSAGSYAFGNTSTSTDAADVSAQPADTTTSANGESSLDAKAEAQEASVSFVMEHAAALVDGQSVKADGFKTASHKDLTFSVTADAGYEVTEVAARNSNTNAAATVVENSDGTYTVRAASVEDGLVIEATAEAQAGSDATDPTPAADSTASETATGESIPTPVVTYQADADEASAAAEPESEPVAAAQETRSLTASKSYKVSFSANGGTASAPASVTVKQGSEITLPDYSGTKANSTFVGWSTDKNATAGGSDHYTKAVYSAGQTYTVGSGNVTLYAVWASNSTTDAIFYIRLDGTIPTEPQGHSSSEYTAGIKIDNAISAGQAFFHTDSKVGVGSCLSNTPTNAQISAVYPNYDASTQYVMWYVVKHEGEAWHIDGVLLSKTMVNLSYDANAPAGTWSNMPDGSQYASGATATVSDKTPTRAGYTFTGWNTKADGSGTPYAANATFDITRNVTLYAQWKANESTAYKVERYQVADDGTELLIGQAMQRYGTTGAAVSVLDSDKAITGYKYKGDSYAGTVLSGTIAADGSTTLKLYFEILKPVWLTFKAIDGETTIAEPSGQYDDVFTSEKTVDIDFSAAKSLLANTYVPAHPESGVTVAAVEACQTMDDITALGFSFSFDGWYTQSQNGGYPVAQGSDMANLPVAYHEMTTGDQTLFTDDHETVYAHYAVSYKQTTGTVQFDANGGDQQSVPSSVSGIAGTANNNQFPATVPTWEGHTFVGWNTQADGMGSAVTDYAATFAGGTTTYYAQWKQNTPITLTANGGTATYNGSVQGTTGYTGLPEEATFAESELAEITASGSGIDAATYAVTFNSEAPATIYDEEDNGYDVTYRSGEYVIDPAPVTVTANHKSKAYGMSDPSFDATVQGLFNSDAVSYSLARAEGEDKGTYAITPSGVERQGNYVVSYYPDDMDITAADISTTRFTVSQPADVTYNGKEQKQAAVVTDTLTGRQLEEGVDCTLSYNDSDETNVGTVKITVTGIGNYSGSVDRSYQILPVAVTVTAQQGQKTFGDADPVFSATVSGLIEGESSDLITYSVARPGAGADEAVGTYENAIVASGDDSQGNYVVTYAAAKFIIIAASDNAVTTASYTGVYDGKAHGIAASAARAGSTLWYSTDNVTWQQSVPSFTDATSGAQTVYVKATLEGYLDAFGEATVSITPAPLSVTTSGASKVYDGQPLSEAGYAIEGWVAGEQAEAHTTGTITDVGSVENGYAVDWDAAGATAKQANYTIAHVTLGELRVAAAPLTVNISGNTAVETYDGTEKSVSGYSVDSALPEGVVVSLSAADADMAKGTDAGVYQMGLVAEDFAVSGAGNYIVTVVVSDGKLTVDPQPITVHVTGNNATDTYDGAEHHVAGFTADAPEGSDISIALEDGKSARAKRTDAGTTNMGLQADDFTATSSNYQVTIAIAADGYQTINPITDLVTVRITGNTGSGIYNAAPLEVSGYTSVVDNALYQTSFISFDGNATASLTDAGTKAMGLAKEQFSNVSANFSNVSFAVVDGSATVAPAPLTVVTRSASKSFDGTALTASGSMTGLVGGETATFATTGSQVAQGASDNTYDITWDGTAKQANYQVTATLGTLEVTAATPVVPDSPDSPDGPTPPAAPVDPVVPDSPVVPNSVVTAITPSADAASSSTAATSTAAQAQDAGQANAGESAALSAAGADEAIDENATPLGVFDEPSCWAHWFMLTGIIATVIYGAGVLLRRRRFTQMLKKREDRILGLDAEETGRQATPAVTAVAGKEA